MGHVIQGMLTGEISACDVLSSIHMMTQHAAAGPGCKGPSKPPREKTASIEKQNV
jgi:hypothetical protein